MTNNRQRLYLFSLLISFTLRTNLVVASSKSIKHFFSNHEGHTRGDLCTLYQRYREQKKSIVYLAGDSTLDNKAWVRKIKIGKRFDPATLRQIDVYDDSDQSYREDVSHWLNRFLKPNRRLEHLACLNTAVQDSLLFPNDRLRTYLQDEFIQKTITARDYLVVSAGQKDFFDSEIY